MNLLKEPLIHFLAGSLLVFGFFWATGSSRDTAEYEISINQTDIERLKTGWVQNFRRAPTQAELDGLIDQEIKEEIYYREALRLGLDRNDPLIRRRLYTKMRFLDNQEATGDDPSDDVLKKWMDDHPGKYAMAPLYDLEQIYLGQNPAMDEQTIITTLASLNQGNVQPDAVGQSIALPAKFKRTEISQIERQFGETFSAGLNTLPRGEWHGPISSGYGIHLVRISEIFPGKSPSLNDVRQTVTNDWRAAETIRMEEATFAKYRSQYDVKVTGRKANIQ
ncbi:peptidyl-prolyl cis-trans isomerase [Parasphingorhabdus sp. JC815]|uniref:peptidyl-prolyl cis-trans isomerase n=1 Tax=Parasphingorhabdus sp. JC815 TaxID=3232140 RepID=UPI0034579A37